MESPQKSAEGAEASGGAPEATAEAAVLPRLPVHLVEHLHRLLGGDARVEEMVLRFIADRYGVTDLMRLPAKVALEIIKRPADFLTAAKNHCEPELSFRTGTHAEGQR